MGLNTTPRTWVAGEVVTAVELNAEVRDALTGLQAAWTTYTPTTVNLTLGNGTLAGRYRQIGKTIDYQAMFTLGSTSAVGTAPTISLPVTALALRTGQHSGNAFDTSASVDYLLVPVMTSTSVVTVKTLPGTAGNNLATIGAATPMTWATGDILTVVGRYEAA